MCLGKQWKVAQELGLLPPAWENQMEFHAPGFGLAHPDVVAVWLMDQKVGDDLCVSLFLPPTLFPLSLPVK